MPARKKSAARKQTTTRKRSAAAKPADAIALLKADHQRVQDLFDKFEKTRSDDRKATIAQTICKELEVHTQIEEEIFYPAAREAMRKSDLLDEAAVEHDTAKTLVSEIRGAKPGDALFDAKVKVLGEYVKHHVKEEQNQIFPQVRKTRLDLKELGQRLDSRRNELMQGAGARGGGETQRRRKATEQSEEGRNRPAAIASGMELASGT